MILNHKEPYDLADEPQELILEPLFSIDTEDERLLEMGLTDIETFDVDEDDMVFIIQWQTKENYVYKFDPEGNYLSSFCRRGQGPGELEWGGTVLITPAGEVMAKDPSKAKYILFDREGRYLKDVQLKKHFSLYPLHNGNYFVTWQDQDSEIMVDHIGICDNTFELVTELGSFQWNNPMNARFEVNCLRMNYTLSEDRIFISRATKDYDIHVYDLSGKLIQKIRKDHDPVAVTDVYKDAFFKRYPENDPYVQNLYFTKYWPPVRFMFSGDDDRRYVMTYEEGEGSGEFIYDVYNPDGVFIDRISLNNVVQRRPAKCLVQDGRLFHIEEKESGFKTLQVHRMVWK
ncbi:MAG: hypothetical protein MUP70_05540 [Candidatus Aminicenantes bacterium]|nr:hypothetical protein [Candidatus Aminicenantes bacterium]